MSDADEVTAFRSHWWWRPGWGVGTRYYAWHLTFDDQPGLHRLVALYQAVLGAFPVLDPVPPPWLYLTTQGVGHVAEVPADDLGRMVDAVRARLATLPRLTGIFGPAELKHEGVEITPVDREPFRAVQRAIRQGMAKVLEVPGDGGTFWPHVSLAYANGVAPIAPVRDALAAVALPPVAVTLGHATLIEMHRDHRQYEWRVMAAAPIGP